MEKAVAVTIITDKIKKDNWDSESLKEEFGQLVRSARVALVKEVACSLRHPTPSLLLGRGKVEEIRGIADAAGAGVVIFSEELSGTQQKNIEELLEVKTIDRTQLILDIFARRAHSGEGKIQVELAQLEYLLPRLTGKGITLSRLGGGIGTRGPGEQKLEVDRRRIKQRIAKLKNDLGSITEQRDMRRKKRRKFSLLSAALIGYTNAGKSTLLNKLTGSKIFVDDMLFSTLDPTIRKYTLPNNQNVLFADTVGFIYKLPHNLIEAFKATLEEAVEADILLHVLDISHPMAKEHSDAVYKVLEELGIGDKPVITVLNKADKIEGAQAREKALKDFNDSILLSALYGENIEELIDKMMIYMGRVTRVVEAEIPIGDTRLLYYIYNHGKILKRVDKADSIYIEALVPQEIAEKLQSEGLIPPDIEPD